MPRLPPQFNGTPAVISHRLELGDLERTLMRKQIAIMENRSKSNQVIELSKTLAVPAIIGVAGFGAFYFLSKALDNIGRAFNGLPLDNIQQSLRKGTNASRGYNSDGSYPTLLTVDENSFSQVGSVRVDVPGFTGGFGSSAFILSKKRYEIVVMGNFNENAQTVEELTPSWLPYSQWKEANEDGREYVS